MQFLNCHFFLTLRLSNRETEELRENELVKKANPLVYAIIP